MRSGFRRSKAEGARGLEADGDAGDDLRAFPANSIGRHGATPITSLAARWNVLVLGEITSSE
jgi:hypothetical protein